jgi:hypothetical protein
VIRSPAVSAFAPPCQARPGLREVRSVSAGTHTVGA